MTLVVGCTAFAVECVPESIPCETPEWLNIFSVEEFSIICQEEEKKRVEAEKRNPEAFYVSFYPTTEEWKELIKENKIDSVRQFKCETKEGNSFVVSTGFNGTRIRA